VLELEIPLDDAGTDDAGDSSTDASTSPNSDEKPQRFGFVRLTLKGGTLAELHDDEKVDAARKDRLFNLGFGPRDRKLWDSDPKVLPSALDAASKQEAEQSAAPAPSATDTAVPAATPAASPAPIDDDKLRELYGS